VGEPSVIGNASEEEAVVQRRVEMEDVRGRLTKVPLHLPVLYFLYYYE